MDKFVFPRSASSDGHKPIRRRRWWRSIAELDGRLSSKYRHELSSLLLESYSEMHRIGDIVEPSRRAPLRREGISGLEFDTKVNSRSPFASINFQMKKSIDIVELSSFAAATTAASTTAVAAWNRGVSGSGNKKLVLLHTST
ncbi:hypothetical protein NE237_009038 [Protea cynaroides]|uniref:Uncharacterized protein n=1 Tax=Protea cynaroides TaxID=273540 RepID=A0A9Q0KWT5_9MAGN|nr:hypothetical protein NE237_009038 [Protea cynaroides]